MPAAPPATETATGTEGSVALGGAVLHFRLPSSAWSAAPLEKNAHAVALGFQRAPIEDTEGRQVIPAITIVVEKLAESPDIVAYTMAKRMAVPFHVDSLFIWENEPRLKLKNAMCYEGNISYPDSANPSDPPLVHRLVILHGVEGKFGIQVIEDSTDSVYATVRPEFRALLWSLSIGAAGSPRKR